MKKANHEYLQVVTNGFLNDQTAQNSNFNDLVHLQVRGKSQLNKEIEELKALNCKQIDDKALTRNELTAEIDDMKEEIIQSNYDYKTTSNYHQIISKTKS